MNWAQHSVLKRIMEKNDPPGRMMVLAVAALRQPPATCAPAGGPPPPPQLVLTDGWCVEEYYDASFSFSLLSAQCVNETQNHLHQLNDDWSAWCPATYSA